MSRGSCWWVIAALACGGAPAAEQPDEPPARDEQAAPDSVDREIVMPAYPVVASGRFGLVTAAEKPEYRFTGNWAAQAQSCDETHALQLFVFDPVLAVALVAGVPDTGAVTGHYEVVTDREGLPTPGTARVALQTYATDRAYSLPAVEGTVEIDSLGDVVSGRLAVSLFETVFLDTVRMAAAFRELPVRPAAAEACRVIGMPADSSMIR